MTKTKDEYVVTSVNILRKHLEWINKKNINLSRYLRSQIEADMDNEDEV